MSETPLQQYLAILKSASPEDNPYTETDADPATGAALAELMRASAAFVEAALADEEVGFDAARATMESVVHTFPVTERPLDVKVVDLSDPDALTDLSEAEQDAIAELFGKMLDRLPEAEHPLGDAEGGMKA